jgi:RNA polymerase sigma factor (sigma-70 family)
MAEENFADIAAAFEANRPRLRAIAPRMLGSATEADDAVQEAWLRLHRSDSDAIDNLGAWLSTVVSRVCLDVLRSRSTRREDPLPEQVDDLHVEGPEDQTVQADAVGAALLVVLDTLGPTERMAFVLHDLFGVPFDDIAPIIDRTPAAARQLASRARRRVQGAPTVNDHARQRLVVDAFLTASRNGEFTQLVELLDPDAVMRADSFSVDLAAQNASHGAPLLQPEVRGADAIARVFNGRAQESAPALIDGEIGFAWAPAGKARSVFVLTIRDGRVVAIEQHGAPDVLAGMKIELLA